jgi:hypothetical protein
VGSVLGALAGEPGPSYSYDKSGKLVVTPPPPLSTSEKIKRIAANALIGLSAPTPREKSGLASALAGVGAGFGAVRETQKEQDIRKRGQAKEEFEQEQRAELQKHQISSALALTARNWAEAQKLGVDLDPVRQSGIALMNAAKEANIPGVKTMTASEWEAAVEKNPELTREFIHVPAGFSAPTVDENGQIVKPGEGQITVIPATGDGQIALPQAFMTQVEKFAPLSGRLSKEDVARIPAGHNIPVNQLPALIKAVEEGRNTWLNGEHSPILAWEADKPVLINPITQEPVSYSKPEMVPEVAKEAERKQEESKAKQQLESAQAVEAVGKAKESLANAALAWENVNLAKTGTPDERKAALDKLMGAYNNLPPDARGYLQNLSPENQATVLSIWAGRQDPKSLPTTIRKGTGQLSRQQIEALVERFDPTWRENKYEAVKKLDEDFTTGKDGIAISSFNQFMQHAAEAQDLSTRFARTNSMLLNMPLNEARKYLTGGEDAQLLGQLKTAITAASDEWGNFIKGQHAMTSDETRAKDDLINPNSPVRVILGALHTMGSQGVARLGAINERYKTVTGMDYPNLVQPESLNAAQILDLGDRVKHFRSGGTVFTGGSPLAPSGAPAPAQPSAEVYDSSGTKLIGHIVNNKFVPLAAPQQ